MCMAIVIDEQEKLLGIITVEELLEEIVGDITEEAKKDEKSQNTSLFFHN